MAQPPVSNLWYLGSGLDEGLAAVQVALFGRCGKECLKGYVAALAKAVRIVLSQAQFGAFLVNVRQRLF